MSTTFHDDNLPAPPAEAPKQSGFQRIIGVLSAPDETFRSIAERPDWVTPLLLTIIISIVSLVLIAPHIDYESTAREAIEAQHVPAGQAEQAVRMGVAISKVITYLSPALIVLVFLLQAVIFLVAFRLMGGEGTFRQAWAIALYASMPNLVRSVIGSIVLLVRGSYTLLDLQNPIASNLGFLADMKTQPVLYALLSSIDAFSIWTLVLLIIGFSYMSKFSKQKSAVIVLVLWVAFTMLKLIGPAMQQLRIAREARTN